MPIYEYVCSKCDDTIEVMQKFDDPAPSPCPACGAGESLSKIVSRSSFQLKGGGWYADLYSSTNKSANKGSGGGETSSS